MKLIVLTDRGRVVTTFAHAERMDYVDYSAELDEAIAEALRLERKRRPRWLMRAAVTS